MTRVTQVTRWQEASQTIDRLVYFIIKVVALFRFLLLRPSSLLIALLLIWGKLAAVNSMVFCVAEWWRGHHQAASSLQRPPTLCSEAAFRILLTETQVPFCGNVRLSGTFSVAFPNGNCLLFRKDVCIHIQERKSSKLVTLAQKRADPKATKIYQCLFCSNCSCTSINPQCF